MSGLPTKPTRPPIWIASAISIVLVIVCLRSDRSDKLVSPGRSHLDRRTAPSTAARILEVIRREAQVNSLGIEMEAAIPEAAERDDANPFLKQGIAQVYGRWLQLVQSDEAESDAVLARAALAELLRSDPSRTNVLDAIDRLISDRDAPDSVRIALAGMLGESATSDGLARLLELYGENAAAPQVREAALEAIGTIASPRWDDTFREELTPELLQAWTHADADLREHLSKAIAQAGSSTGVEFLFSTILAAGTSADELKNSEDMRIAVGALREITNPAGIELLNRFLRHSGEGELAYLLAGGVLAGMGRLEATQAILRYAEAAPESAAPYVEGWLSEVKDAKSLLLMRESADRLLQPRMQQAVRNAWKSWYAQRSLQKPR